MLEPFTEGYLPAAMSIARMQNGYLYLRYSGRVWLRFGRPGARVFTF